MNILNKLNLNFFDKAISKISSEWNKQDLNIKQFAIDTFSGNYKVDKKTKQNLIIYISLLVIPIEEIIGAIAPRLKTVYSFVSTPLDEAALIGKIIMIINAEYNKYIKFKASKNYEPAKFSDIQTLDINLDLVFEQLKTVIKMNPTKEQTSTKLITNNMHQIYEPDAIFKYTDEDYKHVIIEYLIANDGSNNPVKIDYKAISKNVIFKKGFDIPSCERVVQNQMKDIINKNGIEQLHTYRLTNPMYTAYNYLKSKTSTNTNTFTENTHVEYIENSAIIKYNQEITVELIAKIINTVGNVNLDEFESITVLINDDIIIGFTKNNPVKVQAISKNIECLKLAVEIEKEISSVVAYTKIKRTKVSLSKLNKQSPALKQVANYDNLKLSVEAFTKRIISDPETQEIELNINDLRYFIPLYDKNNLTNYLHLLEASEACPRISDKVIVMKTNKVESTLNPSSVSFETLFYTRACYGNYDYYHLVEITQIIYVLQSLYSECDSLDINMLIDCGNKIYISVHIGTKSHIKLIDMGMKLRIEKQYSIVKQLNYELKKNIKALDILSKANANQE